MSNVFDIVYREHCCKCPLRNRPNCYFQKCSKDEYEQWLKDAKKQSDK